MPVMATCPGCRSDHSLGRRQRREDTITTTCPECGASPYETYQTGPPSGGSQRERIEQTLEDIPNVGEKTLANILDRFSYWDEFVSEGQDELETIRGVGTETAEAIRAESQRNS